MGLARENPEVVSWYIANEAEAGRIIRPGRSGGDSPQSLRGHPEEIDCGHVITGHW